MNTPRWEWPIAVHEAGHAVAARALGVEVIRLWITIGPAEPATFIWRGAQVEMGQCGYESRAKISLAGPIAEARVHHCPTSALEHENDFAQFAAATRWMVAIKAARRGSVPPWEIDLSSHWVRRLGSLRRELRAEVGVLVETHWQQVERIAAVLMEREILSGTGLDEILA